MVVFLEYVSKYWISNLEKKSIFGPKTAILVNQDPNNSQLISQMGTHQETEIIESYLMKWGQYDPIKSSQDFSTFGPFRGHKNACRWTKSKKCAKVHYTVKRHC